MKAAIITQEAHLSGTSGHLLRDQRRIELADLNQEVADLAARIHKNFEGLGI